jgi:hypothetical protein
VFVVFLTNYIHTCIHERCNIEKQKQIAATERYNDE